MDSYSRDSGFEFGSFRESSFGKKQSDQGLQYLLRQEPVSSVGQALAVTSLIPAREFFPTANEFRNLSFLSSRHPDMTQTLLKRA